ncbi:protein DA1 [bacterium]|nr:protein DA1 [bacterium]
MHIGCFIQSTLVVLFWTFAPPSFAQTGANATVCDLCGKPFGQQYYLMTDKVTRVRRAVCGECLQRPDRCFACGLPIVNKETDLSDGRHYCERDSTVALFTVNAIQKVVVETEARLRRQFIGVMDFPDHNLNVSVVDRVNIEALFSRPGNDYRCPNIMGYYQALTNRTIRSHEVYLLSGLTESGTRGVFAHELTHAWMADHVPADRQLGGDAREGFCELIAYLVQKDLHDETGMHAVEVNKYTRGQFDLFRRAEKTYNLETVIEWLCYGTEPLLDANDLDMVRRAQKPAAPPAKLWVSYASRRSATETPGKGGNNPFVLKAIVGSDKHRTALINDQTFAEGESAKVKWNEELVTIRCLKIDADLAEIEVQPTGEKQTLHLGSKSAR